MNKKYVARLEDEERTRLEALVSKGKAAARTIQRAWVLLKADMTQFSSGPVEEIKKTFGIQGVPTLIFLDGGGQERENLRTVGFIEPGEMLDKIRQTEAQP